MRATVMRIDYIAVQNLLIDWLGAECSRIGEVSTDLRNDWQRAINRARERAATIGIEWSDSFVPGYIAEMLDIEHVNHHED